MSILRLAIPSPLRTLFDYLPPVDLSQEQVASLRRGCRIKVPFGRRELIGILIETVGESSLSPGKLKPAIAALDHGPLISIQVLDLCLWAARYYHHPLGEVLAAAFPAELRKGGNHRLLGTPGWMLNTRGKGLAEDALSRSPRQSAALKLLRAQEKVPATQFQAAGISAAVMKALLDKDLVQRCTLPLQHNDATSRTGLDLNDEQATAVIAIGLGLGSFSCHLLEGVTGSGKTEVYLQVIASTLERGEQALILVPEIGLTPQTLRRFEDRFNANIVNLHSGLSEGERYRAWESARTGDAHIVIGTRSSVFVPLKNPGLIVVDEEHDGSYKQQDGFRYSARDIAIKRAQLEDCPVILGSATPSLESIHNADSGRYQHHILAQRAGGAELPAIDLLDIRKQPLNAGMAPSLLKAVESTLQNGKQVLLFLNRRGFAPTLLCHDCGWLGQCHHCDARLTVHRRQSMLRCHHCGASQKLPTSCPECHGSALMTSGLGTEQAEDFLRREFPATPLHRVDSDSMRGKKAMEELVEQVNTQEPCILLGTQMLTKGHHFPAVALVAVIDADAILFSADFRGEERMAQLLTQVAGRAGRAGEKGQVILQTHYPDHPALNAIVSLPYAEHARQILVQRLSLGLPPASSMVMIRTDAKDARAGEDFLFQLRKRSQPQLPLNCTIIGPLPAPMQRRAGKYRSQLILSGNNRQTAQAAASILVGIAAELPARQLNWTIDIDPQDGF